MRRVENLLRYPHVLFFIIAGVTLFAALVNYHSSILVKDYIEMEGEVCNLESERVLWHQSYVTRYNYDIVWYDDGEEYTMHLEEQVDPVEEGTRSIWVQPDNKHAVLSNSVEIGDDVPLFVVSGLICGVIGLIICKYRGKNRRESRMEKSQRLEDTKLYSVMALILVLIGIIMYGVMCYQDYRKGEYISPLVWDPLIAMVVIEVIVLGIYLSAAKKLKK